MATDKDAVVVVAPIDGHVASKTDIEKNSQNELPNSEVLSEDDETLYGWRLGVVQFCLLFSLVLSVMDSSVVATALVDIGRYFDDFVTLQWVVLSYLLTYLGFALIFARISDVLGRKNTTLVAVGLLAAMSLGCGLSRTLEQLIAFRALQGLGGSGAYAMAMTALPEVTPPDRFAAMSALIGVAFAASAVLGPVLGGIITTHASWRWCFLFNVPCAVFIGLVALLGWPTTNRRKRTDDDHGDGEGGGTTSRSPAGRIGWRQLDLLGCLLYLAATVLLVFALQEAGAEVYAWDSPTVVACLVVAGLALVAFGLWIWFLSYRKRAVEPLIPGRIFLDRTLVSSVGVTILVGYVFYSILIELPERFQIVNGKSSQTAGISLLPLSGASAVSSALGGLISSKRNNTFVTLLVSTAIVLLATGLLRSVELTREVPAALYGFEALLGFGIGGTLSSSTIIVKLNAKKEDTATTQGLIGQSRILGGNIGLAIATIVLNRHFSSDLQGVLSPAEIADLKRSLNVIETLQPAQVQAVGISFAESFRAQVQICVYVAAAAFLLCLLGWQKNPTSMTAMKATVQKRGLEEKEKSQLS